jgi:hypothetical protein
LGQGCAIGLVTKYFLTYFYKEKEVDYEKIIGNLYLKLYDAFEKVATSSNQVQQKDQEITRLQGIINELKREGKDNISDNNRENNNTT